MRGNKDQADLDVADENVRDEFADEDFARTRGHGEKIFHRAAFALARDGQSGHQNHRQSENDTHQAGHNVVLGNCFWIVERVHAQIDRTVVHGQRFERAFQIILQGGVERCR